MSAPMAAVEAAAAAFALAVARTGLLTVRDVMQQAGVGYKTVSKHRRAGLLAGERRIVLGKLIWLFEPAEVRRYAENAKALVEASRSEGRARGGSVRATAPEGWHTVADLVARSGRTAWCIYDHIAAGGLAAKKEGSKGAFLIAAKDAAAWLSVWLYAPILPDLATIPAAAGQFGISEGTLRSAIRRGDMRAYSLGDVRTQAAPGAQVGRAASLVRVEDVRELAKRVSRG